MALNIKNPEVERLADELARVAGQTKTEVIRQALLEHRRRLSYRIGGTDREARVLRFLERDVWPHVPAEQLGRRLAKREEDDILGYGPEGV